VVLLLIGVQHTKQRLKVQSKKKQQKADLPCGVYPERLILQTVHISNPSIIIVSGQMVAILEIYFQMMQLNKHMLLTI
jgi:hypothetical protein